MKISQVLTKARAWARDAIGQRVRPKSARATCWCLVGSVRKASFDCSPAELFLRDVLEDPFDMNDSSTHLAVLIAADFAILAAKDENL